MKRLCEESIQMHPSELPALSLSLSFFYQVGNGQLAVGKRPEPSFYPPIHISSIHQFNNVTM
jgi:hypothetical protein